MFRELVCEECGQRPTDVNEVKLFVVHVAIGEDFDAVQLRDGVAMMDMARVHCRCWRHSIGFPPRMTPATETKPTRRRRAPK